MPRSCVVVGSFAYPSGTPVQGLVRFTPSRLWVVMDGITWACLAPEAKLDPTGRFRVELTATDNDPVPFTYLIETPAQDFACYVPYQVLPYTLRQLAHEHCVRPGA
jgi:hypothetical protein